MKQVELSRIIINEKRQEQVIVLKEKDGSRQFPIIIGILEASAIKIKLANMTVPRPMTHDLLMAVVEALGARLEKVVIDKLEANTFHAKLHLRRVDEQEAVIDARPSDAIALAVRAHAPIFAEDDVLEKAALFKIE